MTNFRPKLLSLAVVALGCSTSSSSDDSRDARRDTQVLAAGDTPTLASAAASPKPVQALVGSYRHAGGQAEQDALEAAVEAVVQEMNVLTRDIARKRLLAANKIPDSLVISTSEHHVTIQFDDRKYTGTIDGPAVDAVGITGDALRMTLRMREGQLVQHFVGDKGKRTNSMRRKAETVVMHVVVESESLPKSLVYDLTFAAKG